MKKYVFSFINFHNYQLTSTIIESDKDSFTVSKEQLNSKSCEVYDDISTMEELKSFVFDQDAMFEIIEV